MKYILPFLILFGLIAAPGAAFAAASNAAVLWWTRVLPSLLPYLVASSLLMRSGLVERVNRRALPPFLILIGALGGYPVGAKLSGKLYQSGLLTRSDAQKAAVFSNLPNPVFLISVVASGMFSDPSVSVPLLLGVYGTALFGWIPLSHIGFSKDSKPPQSDLKQALPSAIGDGVQSILHILGCIVFASVLGALIEAAGLFSLFGAQQELARAVLLGMFEMTCGSSAAAALPLSLPLRLALCAFLIQFGGLSVLLQSAAFLPLSLPRFCLIRFCTALAAAIAVYLLTPLFCPDVPVPTLASGAQMLQNSFDMLTVFLSAAFGLLLVFVFTFGLSQRKRTP